MAARNYIAVGRANAAIRAFALNVSGLSSDTLFNMLDSAIPELNTAKEQVSNECVRTEQILNALQERGDVPVIESPNASMPIFHCLDTMTDSLRCIKSCRKTQRFTLR